RRPGQRLPLHRQRQRQREGRPVGGRGTMRPEGGGGLDRPFRAQLFHRLASGSLTDILTKFGNLSNDNTIAGGGARSRIPRLGVVATKKGVLRRAPLSWRRNAWTAAGLTGRPRRGGRGPAPPALHPP